MATIVIEYYIWMECSDATFSDKFILPTIHVLYYLIIYLWKELNKKVT